MIAALGSPVLAGFLKIVSYFGGNFFYYLWLFILGVQTFLVTVYPIFILPMFNKLTPLEDGKLKSEIEALATRLNFPLKHLYVIDGSKRSAHSNAYFYGLPWSKQIVIYDTLIEKSEISEVVAVLAHELGHWKEGHTTKQFAVSQVSKPVCMSSSCPLLTRCDSSTLSESSSCSRCSSTTDLCSKLSVSRRACPP